MTGPLELAQKVSRFEDDLDASITSGLADGMSETKSDTERNIEANDSDVSGALKDSVSLDRDAPLDAHHAMQVIIDAEVPPVNGVVLDGGLRKDSRRGDQRLAKPIDLVEVGLVSLSLQAHLGQSDMRVQFRAR